jgi:hypothetical protein
MWLDLADPDVAKTWLHATAGRGGAVLRTRPVADALLLHGRDPDAGVVVLRGGHAFLVVAARRGGSVMEAAESVARQAPGPSSHRAARRRALEAVVAGGVRPDDDRADDDTAGAARLALWADPDAARIAWLAALGPSDVAAQLAASPAARSLAEAVAGGASPERVAELTRRRDEERRRLEQLMPRRRATRALVEDLFRGVGPVAAEVVVGRRVVSWSARIQLGPEAAARRLLSPLPRPHLLPSLLPEAPAAMGSVSVDPAEAARLVARVAEAEGMDPARFEAAAARELGIDRGALLAALSGEVGVAWRPDAAADPAAGADDGWTGLVGVTEAGPVVGALDALAGRPEVAEFLVREPGTSRYRLALPGASPRGQLVVDLRGGALVASSDPAAPDSRPSAGFVSAPTADAIRPLLTRAGAVAVAAVSPERLVAGAGVGDDPGSAWHPRRVPPGDPAQRKAWERLDRELAEVRRELAALEAQGRRGRLEAIAVALRGVGPAAVVGALGEEGLGLRGRAVAEPGLPEVVAAVAAAMASPGPGGAADARIRELRVRARTLDLGLRDLAPAPARDDPPAPTAPGPGKAPRPR